MAESGFGPKGRSIMARYKSYDYAQTRLVAVSLEDQLEPGTLEHTIHYVVEERLDLSGFDRQRSNDETGRPGYDPRILLKVVLLGYARGKLSSRKLEAACRSNIVFMALTCEQRPDHSTIAEFVPGMGEERIASLFSQTRHLAPIYRPESNPTRIHPIVRPSERSTVKRARSHQNLDTNEVFRQSRSSENGH